MSKNLVVISPIFVDIDQMTKDELNHIISCFTCEAKMFINPNIPKKQCSVLSFDYNCICIPSDIITIF